MGKNGLLEVFISYSHKDESFRQKLDIHLANVKRLKRIDTWHDKKILPGTDWERQIDQHLESADIVLFLLSPDFIASDYCFDVEVGKALANHHQGKTRVIPILIRPCDWQRTPFRTLQALPDGARPVSKWSNKDEAYLNIVKG